MSGVSTEGLRAPAEEWHRHGMLHPAAIDELVHQRLAENLPADPVYSDFFVEPDPLGARMDRTARGRSQYRRE